MARDCCKLEQDGFVNIKTVLFITASVSLLSREVVPRV